MSGERALVDADQGDEALTAESLFRLHGKQLYRIVRRLLGPRASRADVDDLTQQAFLAAHQHIDRFRGESAPLTWLYGIASRVVLMHFRSWRRRRRMIEAYSETRLVEEPITPSAEARVAQRQDLERVWRSLIKLKPKKRVVFLLHEIEGLSCKDIATALEISEGTVHTRLFHARKELLALMRKEPQR